MIAVELFTWLLLFGFIGQQGHFIILAGAPSVYSWTKPWFVGTLLLAWYSLVVWLAMNALVWYVRL